MPERSDSIPVRSQSDAAGLRRLSIDKMLWASEIVRLGKQGPNDGITRLGAENAKFAKEEQQRRAKSPVYVDGDDVSRLAQTHPLVRIVDFKMGFAGRMHHFWVNQLAQGSEEGQQWKTLGHRHTVEAVLHFLAGKGHSIIDGIRYDWQAGDFICVPVFAWHRHINDSEGPVVYVASTTTPLSSAIGQAVFEDERFPEYWTYAQEGEDALSTLIPGGAQAAAADVESGAHTTQAGRLYAEQVAFAAEEEQQRRQGKVLVKGSALRFEPTAMGDMAYVVDSRLGFHVKAMATVVGRVPAGKHSGAHRHLYDEIDYVLQGRGICVIDDVEYPIKKGDTLAIPVWAWHQYFNTASEPLLILSHSTRTALENLGLVLTHQGELADY